MKLIHTSDWHLGRSLYGRKRTAEHIKFLDWLAETIESEKIDLLCIAGDVFDSTNPSNRAQSLYYGFLQKIIAAGCKDVVVIAGNHDSPTLLEAPKELLKSMHVHVVGHIGPTPEDEIINIRSDQGELALIVCAVPYLRDRDIRTSTVGETTDDKSRNLLEGIAEHYKQVVALAEQKQRAGSSPVPIVTMGHLFAAGGRTVEGDGVRDLYVGSLAHVPADIFPESIDYLALGHLHRGQLVAGRNTFRYCGSPLPMSFSEAESKKQVLMVTLNEQIEQIQSISVPIFQKLVSIKGNLPTLLKTIDRLKENTESAWLEITYEGEEGPTNVQETLRNAIKGSKLEILRIVNTKIVNSVLQQKAAGETLEELTVDEVFARCLLHHKVSDSRKIELSQRLNQIVTELHENDSNAD